MSLAALQFLTPVRRAKAPFADAVLVCGKCARKLGPKGKAIRKALKAAAKRRPAKVRVIETRCFDLCPKRRVVLASARTLAERRLLVVEPGFDAAATLDQLLAEDFPAHSRPPARRLYLPPADDPETPS